MHFLAPACDDDDAWVMGGDGFVNVAGSVASEGIGGGKLVLIRERELDDLLGRVLTFGCSIGSWGK